MVLSSVKPAKSINQAKEVKVESAFPIMISNPKFEDYNGQAMVTLSYDDGLNDNYELALPIHEKYSIPATFNIIGQRVIIKSFHKDFFNPFKVKDAERRGVEIAAHSYYHDIGLIDKTDEEVHFEFGETKKVLSMWCIGSPETYAVQFSKYDDRVRSIGMQYYKGIRVHGNAQNNTPPNDRYWINSAIAVTNTTTFSDVKEKIDEAIENRQWCVIMLHGIDPKKDGLYEITPSLLEEILQYINTQGREKILPVCTRDALKFTLGNQY
ncbi:polysaccharide deacetylase family protein [Cytobacillus kochii]|uniref:polysaccharide deacetylase family protein n=1 Tax=Cytobacillus kochii TaxID=859143 RepID=UPI001CD3E311|nr:polysaccharide deacetylase family protein [Cytobacillus kochii]MCA1027797.1 polysaccharide deacetylase family protein [Cytobacillus kochii]